MDTTHCQAGHSGFACVPAGHAQAAVAAADGHTRRCRQVGRVRRSTNTSRFQYLLAIRPWVHWALWAYHTCIHEADVHACTADNSFCQNCSLPDLNQSQHRASFTLHGQCAGSRRHALFVKWQPHHGQRTLLPSICLAVLGLPEHVQKCRSEYVQIAGDGCVACMGFVHRARHATTGPCRPPRHDSVTNS